MQLKSEIYHVNYVDGVDKLDYTEDKGSPATYLIETQLLLYSTFLCAGNSAKPFYLDTSGGRVEFCYPAIVRVTVHDLWIKPSRRT